MKKFGILIALSVIGLSALTTLTCRAGSIGNEIIDVKDFGATGNGTTDDTIACQNAVNAANSSGKGLYFPAGTYIIGGTLTCSTEVYGAGENSILKFASGAYAAGTNSLITLHTGGYAHNLAIDGNVSGNITGYNRPGGMIVCAQDRTRVENIYMHDTPTFGISVYNASDAIIRGCRIINAYYNGIEMIDDAHSNSRRRITISDCVVDTTRSGIVWWGDDAGAPTGSFISKIVISNCHVRNTMGCIWGSCGRDVTVTGCTADTATDVGIDFEGCQNCTASGNTVREAQNSGFYALSSCRNIAFSGNTVYCCDTGSPGYGFEIGDAGGYNITISGNTIYGWQTTQAVTTRAISVDDTLLYATDSYRKRNIQIANNTIQDAIIFCLLPQYTSISGNRIYLTTTDTTQISAIELDGSPDCSVEGNEIVRTTPDSGTDTFTAGIDLRIGWMDPDSDNGNSTETGTIGATVRNNYVSGFTNSIVDRGTTTSNGSDAAQLIVGNAVSGKIMIVDMSTSTTVHKETNITTEANRLATDPKTLVTPTTL